MFKDFKEFREFMIFCHTHYELNDVWYFENGDKGILFESWATNETGNQKYCPSKLDDKKRPIYKKINTLMEVYEVWKEIKDNL